MKRTSLCYLVALIVAVIAIPGLLHLGLPCRLRSGQPPPLLWPPRPWNSPGMDWISFTTSSAANLATQQRQGSEMPKRLERYNRDFAVCHRRWFESIYKDKYEYMGEFDLMSLDLSWRSKKSGRVNITS